MSAVSPGALVIFSLQVLAEPVVRHPAVDRDAEASARSVNLIVLFWPDQIASERSLPTFVGVDVEGGT